MIERLREWWNECQYAVIEATMWLAYIALIACIVYMAARPSWNN